MRRRQVIASLGAAALSGLFKPAGAQAPARKTWRLGYLAPASIPHLLDAFKKGLHDLGYVEGQNLMIEYRFGEGPVQIFDKLAASLVQLAPDVIVTVATPATIAAKRATNTIPIVVATAGDLVGNGIVQSLSRPGGNVTGTTLYGLELSQKRLEVLKEAVPSVKQVTVLGNSDNVYNLRIWEDTVPAATVLGLRVVAVMVPGTAGLDHSFEDIRKTRPDALIVLSDASFNAARQQITRLAAEHRLPTMYEAREFVEAGGLISYGPNIAQMSYRAAAFVDKVLKGSRPADLPVEQPSAFELCINMRSARALGLTIPPTLLARADELIE